MRIFALSDLHADQRANMVWFNGLSTRDYVQDVLAVAGDVAHDLGTLQLVFERLLRSFAQVLFVPGNHELWLVESTCVDSLHKFRRILDLCQTLGVQTGPSKIGASPASVWIVPLFSWYVSHCLGYASERQRSQVRHLNNGPTKIWDTAEAFEPSSEREY